MTEFADLSDMKFERKKKRVKHNAHVLDRETSWYLLKHGTSQKD